MSSVKDLKAKVINTLNILSGQDITETKLYKTILTASEEEKKALIDLSATFASTFGNFGKSLKTTEIYKWFKILFNKFKVEGGIELEDLMIYDKIQTLQDNFFYYINSLEELFTIDIYDFNGYDYATLWVDYSMDDESEFNKIAEIIQPTELFILTAITIMAIACHIGQKPFEVYVNMDFKTILYTLVNDYHPLHEAAYEHFQKLDRETVNKKIDLQYIVLHSLVNGKYTNDQKDLKTIVSEGRFMDESFAKIINVSEKSEYEKLKTLYKK